MRANRVLKPVNLSLVIGAVLNQGMASLYDLQSIYSYTDALDLLEVANVRNYNQWQALEVARRGK